MTEGPYKLPAGWRWVRLGEVCEVIMGQSPPSSSYNHEGVGLPFFQGRADFGEIHPAPRVWCTEPKKVAEAGDILISVRAPVGPTNLAESKCCIGRGLAALRVGSVADRFWLLFYLRSIEDELATSGSGSTFNAVTKTELCSLLIPLPPLEEQRRIVARIEELMARVREARRLREQAKEESERLWQSVLADTFPRPGSALPPGWRWVRLGEVCRQTERRDPSKDHEREFLYIDISSVDNSEGKIVAPKALLGHEAPSRARKVIRESDVIFATTRPYLKNIALVPPDLDGHICSTGFCVLRPRRDALNPVFLYYVSRSDLIVDQLSGKSMRGASYPAVTDADVFGVQIPLPPLAEQRRIVAHLEAVREKIGALRAAQAESDAALTQLEKSILDKAFRGELLPTASNEPSAWKVGGGV